MFHIEMNSPIGSLLLTASDEGLHRIEFPSRRQAPAGCPGQHPILEETTKQLNEYFSGHRRIFDLPLAPLGTDFQCRVWQQLRRIPYGITISYAELARRIDQPSAMRAVGAANGRNPIPIVVPCHRVIGANGTLTGFAGGLPSKQFLLRMEGALPQDDLLP